MTKLRKRQPLMTDARRRKLNLSRVVRGFHAPQRDHATPAQHPKPMCGMCGGKVHTRTDFTTGDGWWLCPSCDTGPEVGMPRAA